jgi:hypothetical protein
MFTQDPAALLRRTLAGNASFSALCGLSFLLAGGTIGAAFAVPAPTIQMFGAVLLVFAAYLFLVVRKQPIPRGEAWFLLAMDVGYVVASLIVLVGSPNLLNSAGRFFFWVVAEIVAVFAILEYIGVRKLFRREEQRS